MIHEGGYRISAESTHSTRIECAEPAPGVYHYGKRVDSRGFNEEWRTVETGSRRRVCRAAVSADKNIEYQQSSTERAIAVIVLASAMNRSVDLVPLVPSIIALQDDNPASEFYRIEK